MPVITTGSHPKALWPGVRAWFGAIYNKQPKVWDKIYETVTSEKAYEDDVAMTSFGLAGKKPEGQPLVYDSHNQEWTRRHTHDTYALGYIVTEEEKEDNLYKDRSFDRSKLLAISMAETKEYKGVDPLVNAFDTNYPGGDGAAMCSTAHPYINGSLANTLSEAADFSEAALEDLVILAKNAVNSRGIRFPMNIVKLIGGNDLMFEFERVLHSTLRSGYGTNDINALKELGLLQDNAYITNSYLTTGDWFGKTGCPNGLTHFQRRGLKFAQDNDFDTANAKAKASERYVFDWTDWRGVYGVQGA
jgi:hypothetical protein